MIKNITDAQLGSFERIENKWAQRTFSDFVGLADLVGYIFPIASSNLTYNKIELLNNGTTQKIQISFNNVPLKNVVIDFALKQVYFEDVELFLIEEDGDMFLLENGDQLQLE